MELNTMWKFLHKLASPKFCYRWLKVLAPWLMFLCLLAFAYGLAGALFFAPPDYQQGDVYRIMYLHVPAAILSLSIYFSMAIAAAIYLIWKIKIADITAQVSAPLGAAFTLITLITGSIWGKPTWGTFWIWDARLTSELILFFIYLGIIGIRSAISDREMAARASCLLILIGVVNIPIVHFSVDWWNTLHQGSSLSLLGNSTIAPSMLHPLIAMIVGFFLYYAFLLTIKIRSELLKREHKTQWVREMTQ
jgi:heme exporter protein C